MLVTNRWLLFIKYIESKFSFYRTGSWLKVSISLKPPSRSTTSPTHPFTGRLLRRWNCNWHFDWWMKLKWFFSLSTSSPHIKMCLVNRVNNSNENKRPWHSEFLWTLISILILRPTLKKNLQNSIHERVEKVAPVLFLLKFVKSRYLYNIFMIGTTQISPEVVKEYNLSTSFIYRIQSEDSMETKASFKVFYNVL